MSRKSKGWMECSLAEKLRRMTRARDFFAEQMMLLAGAFVEIGHEMPGAGEPMFLEIKRQILLRARRRVAARVRFERRTGKRKRLGP